MATYVNNLRLTELATGEGSGTWGTTTNTSLELIGEALGYNTQDCFTTDANATTTVADGATDPARAFYFKVTSSATLTATRTLTIAPNTISRVMFIENATTGSQSIAISQGSGANVTIATGRTAVVYLDGAGSTAAVVNAMANVDPGVTDTLAEVLVAGNTSGGTNIQLTTTDEVQFRDTALKISSSADGQLDIDADTELEVTAPTVDINASTAVLISNDLKLDSDSAVLGFGADNDVTLTHIADTALRLNASRALQFRDSAISIRSSTDGQLDIDADVEVEITTTTLDLNGALDVSGNITTRADVTFNGDLYNVIWDKSDSSFEFADQAKAKFGTGADFEIFFNGTVQRFQAAEDVGIEMRNFNTVTSTDVKDVVTLVTNSAGSGGAGFRSGLAIRHTDDDDKKVRILAEQANDFSNAMGMILQTSENNTTQPSDVVKLHSNGDVGFFEDTGTTELFFWDASAEKLGIGTTSPSQPIHVVGSGFTTARFSSTNTVSRITFDNSGQTNESYTSVGADGSDLQFRTNNAERMRIDSSGNVGIGVSSPSSALDVNGTITADGLNVDGSSSGDITVTGATNGNTGFFSKDPTAATYGAFFGYDDANTTVHIGGVTDGTKNGAITIGRDNSLISFAAGGDVQFYEDTGTSIKMKWDASAESLGIGVGAPQASLHIANDASRTQFIASGTVGNDRFLAIDVDITGSENVAYITVDQADSLAFGEKTNDNDRTIANEHMRIDAGGNVGIGTTSPATELDVNGDITTNNINVDFKASIGGTTPRIEFMESDTTDLNTRIRNSTGIFQIQTTTDDLATNKLRVAIDHSDGEFALYNSAGSAKKLVWDATNLNLGINTTSPTAKVHSTSSDATPSFLAEGGTGDFAVPDSQAMQFVHWDGSSTATERMRIDSSGNVGIGTTSPDRTLHVEGTATFETTTGNGAMLFLASDSVNRIYSRAGNQSTTALPIAFNQGSAEAMRIDSSGNVGIGTDSPGATLEVDGTFMSSGNLFLHEATASSSNAIEIGRNRTVDGAIFFDLITDTTENDFNFRLNRGSGANGSVSFRNRGTGAMLFETNLTEAMRIDSSQNVGIGTTSVDSGSKLHVQESDASLAAATGASAALFERAGNAGITIGTANTGDATLFFGDPDSMTIGRVNYDHSDDSLQLWSNSAERVRVDSSGNLLVGKTGTGIAEDGIALVPDGDSAITRSGGSVLYLNRNDSEGVILNLRKDNTTIGGIGVNESDLFIGTGDTTIRFADGADAVVPRGSAGVARDAAIGLGNSANRFKDLYLSGGAYLGGTAAANKLDDYEEGTFTPELADASSGGNTGTATTLEGRYTKVGRQIVVVIKIEDVDTTGMTGANNIFIRGLPFTAGSGTTGQSQGSLRLDRVDLDANCCGIVSSTTSNSTYLTLRQTVDNSADVQIKVQDFTSGSSDIFITITYFE